MMYARAVRHIAKFPLHEQGLGQLLLAYPNLRSFKTAQDGAGYRWVHWKGGIHAVYEPPDWLKVSDWGAHTRAIRSVLPEHWQVLFRHPDPQILDNKIARSWLKSLTLDTSMPQHMAIGWISKKTWMAMISAARRLPRPPPHLNMSTHIDLMPLLGEVRHEASARDAVQRLHELAGVAGSIHMDGWDIGLLDIESMTSALSAFRWVRFDYSPWANRPHSLRAMYAAGEAGRKRIDTELILDVRLAASPLECGKEALIDMEQNREWIRHLAFVLLRAGIDPAGCDVFLNANDCPSVDPNPDDPYSPDLDDLLEAKAKLFSMLLWDVGTAMELALYPPQCDASVKSWRKLEGFERSKVCD